MYLLILLLNIKSQDDEQKESFPRLKKRLIEPVMQTIKGLPLIQLLRNLRKRENSDDYNHMRERIATDAPYNKNRFNERLQRGDLKTLDVFF